mmetsp:Transcript_9760/g.39559  ORF Transcript_9760/g.39559 Transcript_9760/m.39559 type:complete len:319 (-) Transcript_9760:1380-2336(-)
MGEPAALFLLVVVRVQRLGRPGRSLAELPNGRVLIRVSHRHVFDRRRLRSLLLRVGHPLQTLQPEKTGPSAPRAPHRGHQLRLARAAHHQRLHRRLRARDRLALLLKLLVLLSLLQLQRELLVFLHQLLPPRAKLRRKQRGKVPLDEREDQHVTDGGERDDEDDDERHEREDVQRRSPNRLHLARAKRAAHHGSAEKPARRHDVAAEHLHPARHELGSLGELTKRLVHSVLRAFAHELQAHAREAVVGDAEPGLQVRNVCGQLGEILVGYQLRRAAVHGADELTKRGVHHAKLRDEQLELVGSERERGRVRSLLLELR